MPIDPEFVQKKIRARRQTIIKNGTYIYSPKTEEPEDSSAVYDSDDMESMDYAASTDTAQAEEDAKVAEILAKFNSNIQNNVNSLFDNI